MKTSRLVLAALFAGPLAVAVTSIATAKDFVMANLPRTPDERALDLSSDCRGTYYSFMDKVIHPALIEMAERPTRKSNEVALAAGQGLAVRLDDDNFNFHVNFPAGERGGRSYGWTKGKVGDWSDKMYLENLADVVDSGEDELHGFYKTILTMLGACSTAGLSELEMSDQRVANNFLAIYTAEQYRAMLGTTRWDDALLQVTMVAAFHGGQRKVVKYYMGEFTDQSFKQAPGVYRGRVQGQPKAANLIDYWQFSARPDSTRSGINLTRGDFELMGKAITEFEARQGNRDLRTIQNIVGRSSNVIRQVSQYFTNNRARTSESEELAEAVASFLVQVRKDAPALTRELLED